MNPDGNNPIANQLTDWFRTNKRPLVWRSSRDPYRVWLSEIIMQQTRISQGTPYYLKFVKNFPTVSDLAAADEMNVLKLWQGLGYYSRARNMLKTAKKIVSDYKGVFPADYKLLLGLPGIGDYTASVLLSVCFKMPYPVVDGNVTRVVSRLYGFRFPVNSPASKKAIKDKVTGFFEKTDPGIISEALMDLGAMICLPQNPNCTQCPLQQYCIAFKKNLQESLPVKTGKTALKKRFLHYFLIRQGGFIVMNKRNDKDIWAKMYDFPCLEISKEKITVKQLQQYFFSENVQVKLLAKKKHLLTHRELFIRFYEIEMQGSELQHFLGLHPVLQRISIPELELLAVPRPVDLFLKQMNLVGK